MRPLTPTLNARLRPPQVSAGWTHRSTLIDRLNAAQTKVILVVAPAGFGKTALLSTWIGEVGETGAWLSLRSHDSTLPRFLYHLAIALEPFASELPAKVAGFQSTVGESNDTSLANVVLDVIGHCTSPWTLVIDEYEAINTPEIDAFIAAMIDTMPDTCRLVLSTSAEPTLSIARLRVSGDLMVLKADDLRASTAECRAILTDAGVEVNELQVRAIAERTGGWMVGLHLIALTSRTRPVDQVIQSLAVFEGELELICDFFLEEILEKTSPELHAFLLQVSVLDRFTADICHAVTGNPASAQLLKEARRNGLFLIELDDSRTWFKFHDLFSEFLRRELVLEVDPNSILELHEAASLALREQNLVEEALTHSLKARQWSASAEIIRSVAARLFLKHRLARLLTWLERFPRDFVLADPDLSSIAAYAYVRQGRIDDGILFVEAAEAIWKPAGNAAGIAVTEMVHAGIARFREDGAGLIEHGSNELARLAELGKIAESDDYTDVMPRILHYTGTWVESMPNVIPYLQIGLGLCYQGRTTAAEQMAERIVETLLEAGNNSLMTTALTLLAITRVASGRLNEAEIVAAPIARVDADDMPPDRALAANALAEVLYAWDRLDDCEQVVQDGIMMLSQIQAQSEDALLQLQLARIYWSRGDIGGARAALDAAAKSAAEIHNVRRMREVEAFHARIAIATGDLGRAQRWALSHQVTSDQAGDAAHVSENLVHARMFIATGESECAVEWLESMRESASRDGRRHDLVQILALLSVAYLDMFELDRATEVLTEGLHVGETGGYVRVFLDEGVPMLRLLRIVYRRGIQVPYVAKLLKRAGETPGTVRRFEHSDLVEPITSREIEVLLLVALGLTNKEISEELFLAIATVKRHVTNIHGKLGVSSRTEAVQKARKLKLLSSEQIGIEVLSTEAHTT